MRTRRRERGGGGLGDFEKSAEVLNGYQPSEVDMVILRKELDEMVSDGGFDAGHMLALHHASVSSLVQGRSVLHHQR